MEETGKPDENHRQSVLKTDVTYRDGGMLELRYEPTTPDSYYAKNYPSTKAEDL